MLEKRGLWNVEINSLNWIVGQNKKHYILFFVSFRIF